jgi:Ca-activated chloride channel family protein
MAALTTGLTEFHLLRPWWLLLLLPSLLLLWRLLKQHQSESAWSRVVDPELLRALQRGSDTPRSRLPTLLLFSFWLLALIALSGPSWERQPTPGWESEAALVLLLDLSPSMSASDLPPSRLERARFKLMDILQQRREGRTALILFSEEPYLVTPLTDDVNTIRNLLAAIEPDILPTQGDFAAPALAMATQLLQQGGAEQGELLLLSDGVADIADTLSGAHQLAQQGYRLSLLALHPSERATLERIATTGGGRYATLSADDRDIHHLLPKGSPALSSHRARQEQIEHWVEAGVWLLLPIALLAALGFRRGWVLLLLLTTLPHAPPSEALEWADLWLREDQQAARALSSGDAAAAARQFRHEGWRGTALYQQGAYEAAAAAFAQSNDPQAHYNRGNALARGGALEQALEAYQAMLTEQPDHRDAQHNLDLVRQLLQQQQQQQQSGNREESAESSGQEEAESTRQERSNPPTDKQPMQGQRPETGAQPPTPPTDSHNPDPSPSREEEQSGNPPSDPAEEGYPVPPEPPAPDIAAQPSPPSEAEMESAQWLRQIPQDPSGLLRRKFLLEHLYRRQHNQQQNQQTPR